MALTDDIKGGAIDQENFDKIQEKEKEYKKYIVDHVRRVQRAFDEFGDELCEKLGLGEPGKSSLKKLIDVHDQSKFNPIEFDLYRAHFYPIDTETKSEENLRLGFLLHQNSNPHHPEFWVYRDDKSVVYCDMPPIYIAEMLLDWESFHYVNENETAYSYWMDKASHKKPLSNATIKLIESVIDIFDV